MAIGEWYEIDAPVEVEWLSNRLEPDFGVRIFLSGASVPTVRQIDRIIKILRAQKEIAEDEAQALQENSDVP